MVHFIPNCTGSSCKNRSTLSDSVLGPFLFSLYTTPLSSIISQHTGAKFHFYADDTQLYIHLAHNNVPQAFDKLNSCLTDVKD